MCSLCSVALFRYHFGMVDSTLLRGTFWKYDAIACQSNESVTELYVESMRGTLTLPD